MDSAGFGPPAAKANEENNRIAIVVFFYHLIPQGKLVGIPIICTEHKGINVSGGVQDAVVASVDIAGGGRHVRRRLFGTVRNVSLSQRRPGG